MNNYFINVYVSDMQRAFVTEMEMDGVMEEGIFIPFRFNSFYRGKKGKIILNLYAREKEPNPNRVSHFLVASATKYTQDIWNKLNITPCPLGLMKLDYSSLKTPIREKKQSVPFEKAFSINSKKEER